MKLLFSTGPSKRALMCASVALTGLAVAATTGIACAQDQATPSQEPDIIVTGTLLRGKTPVGSNAITVGQEKLTESGAVSSNELLATIPQVSNYFNSVPAADLATNVNQLQISRPNIRNISPNAASSSATLILVDGHRIASAGITQASVDPDVIPTGAIERVEVVTEGGSATYGADAVAGVINFITRKRFDGLKVDGHYGVADKYWQWDASATAGKDWGSGSAWVSYSVTKSRALFGEDRSYIHQLNYASQPYVGLSHMCDTPNINIATNLPASFGGGLVSQKTYAYSPGATGASLIPNTVNTCDALTHTAVVPSVERHGVMAGLTQDLDDSTSITMRAYYSSRYTLATAPMTGTVTMSPNNPYSISPAGAVLGPGASCFGASFCSNSETVDFSFGPLLGNATAKQITHIQEWGYNAELTKHLNDNWEVRGLFNYSGSDSRFELTQPNVALLNAAGNATTTAAAFDPFNLGMTSPSVIANIVNNEIAGQAKDSFLDARLIADGKLFSLPGGDVRLAVGYEFMRDEFAQRYQTDIPIGSLGGFPFSNYTRNVNSLFGELQVPVLGGEGRPSLVLSASGRYDHYSDFGNTTNPKLGATFKPVNWLAVRGNWGTSFTAPTPLDQLGAAKNTITAFPFVAFTRPGDTPAPGSYTVALQGSRPGLQPQKADTWSIGFDASPPIVPGLRVSANYYHVIFKNILSTPSPSVAIFTGFPANITTNVAGLSAAQLLSYEGLAPNGATNIAPLIGSRTVYEFVDFRTGNFGILKVDGLDMSANYHHQTRWGGFDLGANANWTLDRKSQVSATSAVVDLLAKDGGGRFSLQTIAGVNVGSLRAQATLNYSGGYAITPVTSLVSGVSTTVQDRIGSFTTVNLFFKYDVPSQSKLLQDLSLTLNVNNVFDQNPPVSLQSGVSGGNGYTNGFTLGRLFMFGVSKKF